jgi:hypothetical protein
MSNQRLPRWLSNDRMDVSLARLGAVVSALLLGLWMLVPRAFLLAVPLAAGAGSVVYLGIRRSRRAHSVPEGSYHESAPTLSSTVAGYLPAVVLVGLGTLVVAVQLAGSRTVPIYLLTGAIGTVIFVEVLFVDGETLPPGLVLAQIIVAAVVVRLTALYATPGYVGVDIWTHAPVYVTAVVDTGSVWGLSGSKYIMAPLYHILGAVGTLVAGDVRNGIYLTVGLVVPLSLVFVYSTGRMLVPARWALLATAFYAFADQFIRWGMHVIPTSLGLAFFLAAVYGLTRVFHSDAERWAVTLVLVASLAVVFTHQVSTAITLVVLGVATLVAVVNAVVDGTPVGSTRKAAAMVGVFTVTFGTTMVSWAATPFRNGGTFLAQELAVLGRSLTHDLAFLNIAGTAAEGETLGGAATDGLASAVVPYVELVGFMLLLLVTVVGGLYMLRWDRPADLTAAHLLSAGALFVFVFGLPLFGIRALLPGRWVAFLFVSMALLGAVGLYHVSRTSPRAVVVVVFLVVALGYPSTMVVAEKATLDSPAFDDQHKRFAYTQEELAAVESVSTLYPPGEGREVATDHPYVTVYRRAGGYRYDARIPALGEREPVGADAVVYRDYQSSGPATFRQPVEGERSTMPADVEGTVCPPGWNSGYATDGVRMCTRSATGTEVTR